MKTLKKQTLLLHHLVSSCLTNQVKVDLSKSEIKTLYNFFTFRGVKEISEDLYIAEKSLKFHRTNMYRKLRPIPDNKKPRDYIIFSAIYGTLLSLIPDEVFEALDRVYKEFELENKTPKTYSGKLPIGKQELFPTLKS